MASLEVHVVAGAIAPDGEDGTLLSFLIEVGDDMFINSVHLILFVGWTSSL